MLNCRENESSSLSKFTAAVARALRMVMSNAERSYRGAVVPEEIVVGEADVGLSEVVARSVEDEIDVPVGFGIVEDEVEA